MNTIKYILPLLCLACSDVKSSGVNTSGIHADITGLVEDGKTKIEVVMRVGGENSLTYVELEGGDTLEASDGTNTQELSHSSFGASHKYTTNFDLIDPGSEFLVSFKRELEDSAPNSLITLSNLFTTTSPVSNDVVSRSSPFTISWTVEDDTEDEITITIESSCIMGSFEDTVNTQVGSYTINPSDWDVSEGEESESCSADVILTRLKAGSLDPAFGSGSVYGGFKNTVAIRLDP